MYSKILVSGKIEIVTGMHIGGSDAFAAIGAVDSPVIKDNRTKEPIIPGSSLKGKMRTLLARSKSQKIIMEAPDKDDIIIRRLFGSLSDIAPARLIFSDCFLVNAEEMKKVGWTETKFENTINRATAIAMPRQIERVSRGAQFGLHIIYDVHDLEQIREDFAHLALAFNLLQMDYLGGHGTRGYGRVKFLELAAEKMLAADDALDEALLKELNAILKGVN